MTATCSYMNGTWECREGGYLWDADADGYDPYDESYPCPACNTEEYLRGKSEHASGWSSYQWIYTSGAEHWRNAVEIATEANPEEARRVLAEIGPLACDDWADPDAPHVDQMVVVIENADWCGEHQPQGAPS